MKLPLLCALTLLAHSASAALVFTDNFNRANTGSPNGGLGSNYDITGNIFLNSNHALTQTTGTSFALYNGFDLTQSFTLSLDIYSQSDSRYAGLVFNYVDSNNYYILRASFESAKATAWQFLKVINGSNAEVISSGSVSLGNMPLNTWRTLNLSSTGTAGQYNFSLTDVSGTNIYASSLISDTSLSISGQAGLYFSTSFAWADNLSITTVPEPGTWALLGLAGVFLVILRNRKVA
jgi:hypothetical protein